MNFFRRLFSLSCIIIILLSLSPSAVTGTEYQQQLTDPKDVASRTVDIKSISMKHDKDNIYVKSESWTDWNMSDNGVIVYAVYFNVKNTDTSEDCEFGFGIMQAGDAFISALMRVDTGELLDMKNESGFSLNNPIGVFSVKKSLLGLTDTRFSFFARIGFNNFDDRAPNQYGSVVHYKPGASKSKPELSIETNQIDFGEVPYQTKQTSVLRISNYGGGTLTGTIKSNTPAVTLSYAGFDLEENATAEVIVSIYSSGLPTGKFYGEIRITSNGGNSTISVQAEILHKPELSCNTEKIDFGSCYKGERKTEKIRIRNKYPGPLEGTIKAKGKWITPSKDEFNDNTIDLIISLNSKILEEGPYETTLTISTNGGEVVIPVTVTIHSLFVFSTKKVDFGSIVLEDTATIPDQSILITNTSDDVQKITCVTDAKWIKVSLATMELKKNAQKELVISINRKEITASGYFTTRIVLENKYDTVEIPVIINVLSYPPKLVWLKENEKQTSIEGEITHGKSYEHILVFQNEGVGVCHLKASLKNKNSLIRLFIDANALSKEQKSNITLKFDSSKLTAPGKVTETLLIESDGGDYTIPITINVLPKKEVVIVLTIGFQYAYINDQPMKLDAAPYIKKGSTMVPLRFISEAMKAEVKWENIGKGRILISLKSISIQLDIGSTTALVNGKTIFLTAAPEIVQSRTFVPLRFVGESMGSQIDWEAATQKITIRFLEEE